MENGTEQGSPAAGKPLTGFGKAARRKRIFARLREGWAYEEIAREEGITARRARQIVSEALRQREVEDDADHALLQLSRLEPALRAASDAVGKGDVKAIAPLMKVLDRLDHYQKAARSETMDRLAGIIEFQAKAGATLERRRAARDADEAEAEPAAEDRREAPQAGAIPAEETAAREADGAEAGAEDRQEAPPQAEAIPEEQTARSEADGAEAGAEDRRESSLPAEAPPPEPGAGVAAPPPEARKEELIFPLCY